MCCVEITDSRGIFQCGSNKWIRMLFMPYITGHSLDCCRQAASIIRCKNLALYIRDCVSLCLSDETLKAVGPFCLVSMPGEVKDPTQGVNV